jgi:surface antigen
LPTRIKSLLVGVACAFTLFTSALPTASSADTPTSAPASIADQRQRLLQSLLDQKSEVASQVAAAEAQLGEIQNELTMSQSNLGVLNAKMLTVSREITDDQTSIVSARQNLAVLLRETYETSGQTFAGILLAAGNFNDAFTRFRAYQHVSDQVQSVADALRTDEQKLTKEKADLSAEINLAQQTEGVLGAESNRAIALIVQRDVALAQANSAVDGLVAQIDVLDNKSANNAGSISGGGTCGNHFAYGFCTWYVATRRCVPWFGNAWEWFDAAKDYGYAEGHVPVTGAIAVWYPYAWGASAIGHVAYVEAVGPAPQVPAGFFRVSEMNYAGGWGSVSYRNVPNNAVSGFVYGMQ